MHSSSSIVPQNFFVGRSQRHQLLNQRGIVIWFNGLPCSGKTTLADGLEQELFKLGYKTFVLDGDNLRVGLCKDLGFSDKDRSENIRRASEVAKLMIGSGIIVLAAFVTPFEKDRKLAAKLLGNEDLVSVYVNCPLSVCEQRDVKGLYKKARSGELKNFTGISSSFEAPSDADLELKTNEFSKEVLIRQLVNYVTPKIGLKPKSEVVVNEVSKR